MNDENYFQKNFDCSRGKQIITFQNSLTRTLKARNMTLIVFLSHLCRIYEEKKKTQIQEMLDNFSMQPVFTGADKANIKVKFCFYFHAIFRRCRQWRSNYETTNKKVVAQKEFHEWIQKQAMHCITHIYI